MSSASSSFDPSLEVYALESDGDLELRPTYKPPATPSATLLETAALLTLWSLLILNDGAVRFVDPPVTPSFRIAHLAAAVCELLLGISGLVVSLPTFLSARAPPTWRALRALPGLQAGLAAFALVVFVFAEPGAQAAGLDAPLMQGLSLGESRLLAALSMLTSVHLTLGLLGGAVQLCARVLDAGGAGAGAGATGARNAGRSAVGWNANMAAGGAWTAATGVFLRVRGGTGGGGLTAAFVSAPHVGRLPGMSGWTGVALAFWGAVGAIVTASRSRTPRWYPAGSAYVFLTALLNFALVQPALARAAAGQDALALAGVAGVAARQGALAFAMVFLAAYSVQAAARERGRPRAACGA